MDLDTFKPTFLIQIAGQDLSRDITKGPHLRVTQSNICDAQFFKELAEKARDRDGQGVSGYVFYIQDDELHFHPRGLDQTPLLTLEYFTDTNGLLRSFRPATQSQGAKGAGGRPREHAGRHILETISREFRNLQICGGDPWQTLFQIASHSKANGHSDLIPYWIFEDGSARVERRIPLLPYSKEVGKLKRLKQGLALYRMVFGQPRQEDLLLAFDAFMKIDGIEGESTDDKHQGWIELIRYGTGLKQTVSTTASSAGGASAERADFSDFLIRKFIDKSSPKLALACADGTHIDQIVVELCRAGTDKVTFMTYTMKNCLIRKVITTNGNDTVANFPAETVKINYSKIEWRYTQQKRKGGGASGYSVSGWDLQRNSKM